LIEILEDQKNLYPEVNYPQAPGGVSMIPEKKVSSKICLIGDGGVGKTSLIGRYVHDRFDNKYLKTIGTKVSRKEISFVCPESHVRVKLGAMIWDIMGQKAFRNLLQDAYFHGANGLIAVCDLTQRQTLESLDEWIDSITAISGKIPILILANKNDLSSEIQFGEDELRKFADLIDAPFLFTSAKTGENVDEAFLAIGKEMVKNQLNLS
jgi:small GTP-binding protein